MKRFAIVCGFAAVGLVQGLAAGEMQYQGVFHVSSATVYAQARTVYPMPILYNSGGVESRDLVTSRRSFETEVIATDLGLGSGPWPVASTARSRGSIEHSLSGDQMSFAGSAWLYSDISEPNAVVGGSCTTYFLAKFSVPVLSSIRLEGSMVPQPISHGGYGPFANDFVVVDLETSLPLYHFYEQLNVPPHGGVGYERELFYMGDIQPGVPYAVIASMNMEIASQFSSPVYMEDAYRVRVTVTPLPEPGHAMLGVGVGLLMLRRGRICQM